MSEFEPEGSFDVSKFNPAAYKMSEIYWLGHIINEASIRMEAFNSDWHDWNFNIKLNATKRLYSEVFVKFTATEKKECEGKRIAIEKLMEKYPILLTKNKIDRKTLIILIKYIDDYESSVREWQDKHGLGTPSRDEDEDEW